MSSSVSPRPQEPVNAPTVEFFIRTCWVLSRNPHHKSFRQFRADYGPALERVFYGGDLPAPTLPKVAP